MNPTQEYLELKGWTQVQSGWESRGQVYDMEGAVRVQQARDRDAYVGSDSIFANRIRTALDAFDHDLIEEDTLLLEIAGVILDRLTQTKIGPIPEALASVLKGPQNEQSRE